LLSSFLDFSLNFRFCFFNFLFKKDFFSQINWIVNEAGIFLNEFL
jgi:hypothetical protein